jgi:hypothetical protein
MIENHTDRCLDHEHEWCEIPLHEDAQVCAQCGEIREMVSASTSAESLPFEAEPLFQPVALAGSRRGNLLMDSFVSQGGYTAGSPVTRNATISRDPIHSRLRMARRLRGMSVRRTIPRSGK